MFKKHYRSILVLVVLLVVAGSMVFLRSDWYGAYTACRKELPFIEGWQYLRTDFNDYSYGPPFYMIFYSESEAALVGCYVRHNDAGWDVILTASSSIPN